MKLNGSERCASRCRARTLVAWRERSGIAWEALVLLQVLLINWSLSQCPAQSVDRTAEDPASAAEHCKQKRMNFSYSPFLVLFFLPNQFTSRDRTGTHAHELYESKMRGSLTSFGRPAPRRSLDPRLILRIFIPAASLVIPVLKVVLQPAYNKQKRPRILSEEFKKRRHEKST